ncbi:LacI family DNA-binding transcriptional regulator [Paenibacillus typhae]|uniref:LacI family DNA-binding transcriptional regulator n=1 Tax=Paenibacillus typhae TaxID=1174501 RepID=UPI001C8E5462|nr:LacI family DNA-binding transcriptional regulator [Paenibacillus typhae]MBY0010515.1 LacI family DNA-binding transcriptional regulator [Paenibacillus typhae]
MTVTMKKVARRAGVSVSTVSRVLAGHVNVRAETSRRVRETMEELGYTPNIIAQNLVSRTTRCICVLLPDTAEIWPANLYCMEVIRGIVLGAGKLGYDIQLASGDGEREELEAVSRLLKGGRADGAILLSARRSSSVVNFLQQERYPFVLVEDEPAAEVGSEAEAELHETDDGSAGQTKETKETKVDRESAGIVNNSLVGDGWSVSMEKPGWKIADSRSSSLVENGRGEAGDGSKVEADLHETNAGRAGQTKVSGENADERASAMPAAVVPFPGIPDEIVAGMGTMASELLIGSIQRRSQPSSPEGDASYVAQFVLRRPVLRG